MIYFQVTCLFVWLVTQHHFSEATLSIHRNLDRVELRRIVRSPFLPPTVTGLQPSKRSNGTELHGVKIASSLENMRSPVVHSKSTLSSSEKLPLSRRTKESLAHDEYDRKVISYDLPRPPMVLESSDPETPVPSAIRGEVVEEELLIKLQNDQSVASDPDSATSQGHVADDNKWSGKAQPVSKDKSTKRLMKFLDFNQVLSAINMTNGELEALLRRKKIAFHDFLEFIENGASEEQILKLLESPRHQSSIPEVKQRVPTFRKFHSAGDDNSKLFSKGLTELPFTEIVHQVPFDSGKQFDSANQPFAQKDKTELKNKNKLTNRKLSRSPKGKFDKEQSIGQPDYDPDFHNYLPPKDSPIVTHFLPSRNKKNQTQVSASILSMSVEERKTKEKPTEKELETVATNDHPLQVRNKVVSSSSPPQESQKGDVKRPQNNMVSKPVGDPYGDSQYVRQQLRLVFPMKGIVIFCGILGFIAFLTFLMLAIYGTVKCNKTPILNNYKMNEQKDIPLTSS